MKRIVITLNKDLNIEAEGIDSVLEALGLMDYARQVYVNCINEETGEMQVTDD